MNEKATQRKGVIEGSARILREILRTPRCRQSVKILLNELDPENTPLLLRAIQEEAPELFLDLLNTSPALANIAFEGLHELLAQLHNFPPALLSSFLAEQLGELNGEKLGGASALALLMILQTADQQDEKLPEAAKGFHRDAAKGFADALDECEVDREDLAERLVKLILSRADSIAAKWGEQAAQPDSSTAKTVRSLAEGIKEIAAKHPDFIGNVVKPLVEAGREAIADKELKSTESGSDE